MLKWFTPRSHSLRFIRTSSPPKTYLTTMKRLRWHIVEKGLGKLLEKCRGRIIRVLCLVFMPLEKNNIMTSSFYSSSSFSPAWFSYTCTLLTNPPTAVYEKRLKCMFQHCWFIPYRRKKLPYRLKNFSTRNHCHKLMHTCSSLTEEALLDVYAAGSVQVKAYHHFKNFPLWVTFLNPW